MPLEITRKEGETWRECAARYGRKYGLEHEVLANFDGFISCGEGDEMAAAFDSCLEWDICDVTK